MSGGVALRVVMRPTLCERIQAARRGRPTLPAMAATETRLLVLGAVQLFEPVNGYQIRRELMSWEVDEWAHINPGSIYSALSTLAKQGYVDRHDLVDGTREVAVYTTTKAGRAELTALFASSLETVRAARPAAAHTALSHVRAVRPRRVPRPPRAAVPALDAHLEDLRGEARPRAPAGDRAAARRPRDRAAGSHGRGRARLAARPARGGPAAAALALRRGARLGGSRRPTTRAGRCRPTGSATARPSASADLSPVVPVPRRPGADDDFVSVPWSVPRCREIRSTRDARSAGELLGVQC